MFTEIKCIIKKDTTYQFSRKLIVGNVYGKNFKIFFDVGKVVKIVIFIFNMFLKLKYYIYIIDYY